MQLTNRAKPIDRSEMTLAERLYLPAIAGGLALSLIHI